MKKKTLQIFIGIFAILVLGLLIAYREGILEDWRMYKVARQLENSVSIREAYGENVSVRSLDRGVQGGASMATWIHHLTRYRVLGDGVDATIVVRWSHPEKELRVDVQGFSADGSYIDPNENLK